MTEKSIIKNLFLARIIDEKVNPVFCDIEISNGKIEKMNEKNYQDFIDGKYDAKINENEYDAKGSLATVPFINFHDHIYSRLAKGINVKGSTENFHKILKNLWWKLDLILDEEMIRASAMMAAIESIKSGTLYIFDHHSSPSFVQNSLRIITNTLKEFNLQGTICFETSNRNGIEITKKSAQENYEFIESNDEDFKGMFGLHASFTLKDQTLKFVSNLMRDFETGIHIHLCEDKVDREISLKKFGELPLSRLLKFNLLNHKSILAHGIHLKKKEYKKVAQVGSAIALNPDSNMNNSVGLPSYKKLPENLTLLPGTDGMHANIFKTFKQLFLLYRHSGESFASTFEWINRIYFNQISFVKKFFPDFTSLNQGEKADIIIWDYVPVNELNHSNFWGHFIYGAMESTPKTVIKDGKFLMIDHELRFNIDSINHQIIKQGIRLKNKFESDA